MLTNARRPSMVCMLRAPALPTAGVCGSVASRAQTAQSGIHCAALHTLQRMRPVVRRRCARDMSRATPQRAWRGTALRRAHTSRAVRQRDHHDGVGRGRGSGNGAQASEAAEGSGVRDGESSSAGASGGDGDDEYPRSRLFRVVKTTVLAVVGLSMVTAIENVQGPYCASERRWLADVHLRLVESVAGLMGNDDMKKEARTQRQKMAKQRQQEAAAAAKLPTKFMTVDGKKIAYYDSGVGSPVVVVNSTTSAWRWRVCAVRAGALLTGWCAEDMGLELHKQIAKCVVAERFSCMIVSCTLTCFRLQVHTRHYVRPRRAWRVHCRRPQAQAASAQEREAKPGVSQPLCRSHVQGTCECFARRPRIVGCGAGWHIRTLRAKGCRWSTALMPAATAGKLDVHVAVRAEERRLRCWGCHCGADCARPTRPRRPRTSLRLLATGTPCSPRLAAPHQTDAQFMERCLNGTKWWAALLLAPINGAVDLATQLFGNHPHMLNPGARGHVRRRRRGEGGVCTCGLTWGMLCVCVCAA